MVGKRIICLSIGLVVLAITGYRIYVGIKLFQSVYSVIPTDTLWEYAGNIVWLWPHTLKNFVYTATQINPVFPLNFLDYLSVIVYILAIALTAHLASSINRSRLDWSVSSFLFPHFAPIILAMLRTKDIKTGSLIVAGVQKLGSPLDALIEKSPTVLRELLAFLTASLVTVFLIFVLQEMLFRHFVAPNLIFSILGGVFTAIAYYSVARKLSPRIDYVSSDILGKRTAWDSKRSNGASLFFLITCLAAGCYGWVAYKSLDEMVPLLHFISPQQINVEDLELVVGVCNGHGINQASANEINLPIKEHSLVIISDTGEKHQWSGWIPDEFSARSLSEVMLVVCVSKETSEVVQTCEYYGSSIARIQHQVKVRLIAAKTGRVLQEKILEGFPPRECGRSEASGTVELKGPIIKYYQFASWLMPEIGHGMYYMR